MLSSFQPGLAPLYQHRLFFSQNPGLGTAELRGRRSIVFPPPLSAVELVPIRSLVRVDLPFITFAQVGKNVEVKEGGFQGRCAGRG